MSQTKAQLINAVDGSIVTADLADDAVTAAKLAHTSVTAGSYTTADITVDAQGRITAAASGTIANAEIADGAITNAKVNASAAIAGTKVAPAFGLQNITTSGTISSGNIGVAGTAPTISLTDINANDDFEIKVDGGLFEINDATNSANRFKINSNGVVTIGGNTDFGGGIDVTGVITGTSNLSVQGDITGTGDLTIDTNTLHVDSSNNRVGIGTTSPEALLHEKITTSRTGSVEHMLILEHLSSGTTTTGFGTGIRFRGERNNGVMQNIGDIEFEADVNSGSTISAALVFKPGVGGVVTERMRIDSSGRLLLGTTTEGAANADEFTIGTSASTGMTIRSGSSDAGSLFFSDATSGTGEYAGYLQYDHATNYLAIGTNATERMRIDSSGNVGIGTTSPGHLLEVKSSAQNANDVITQIESAAVGSGLSKTSLELHKGTGYGAQLSGFINQGAGSGFILSTLDDGTATERLRIESSGNVGIGTTSPTGRFHFLDGTQNNNAHATFHASATTGTNNNGEVLKVISSRGTGNSSPIFNVLTNTSTSVFAVTGAGKVGIGTTNPTGVLEIDAASTTDMIMLDVGGTNFARLGHNSSGGSPLLDVRSEGHFRILTNGNNERFRISSGGDVGIGTSSPSMRLHVAGNGTDLLKVESSASDALGAHMQLNHDSSSPADNDVVGAIEFAGNDSGGNATIYSRIRGVATDVTNGSEDGALVFGTRVNASFGERMRIEGDKVGIGTTSPSDKLHVRGASAAFTAFILDNATNSSSPYKITYGDQGQVNHLAVANREMTFGTNNTERMRIKSDGDIQLTRATAGGGNETLLISANYGAGSDQALQASNSLRFYSGGANERLRIASNGKIGIGTTSPGASLDIGGSTDDNIQAILTRGSDTNFQLQFRNESSSNNVGETQGKFGLFHTGNDVVGMQFKRGSGVGAGALSFTTGGTERVRLASSGNLGVGTTSPTSKLEIRASSATHQLVSINREDSDTGALFLGCNSSDNAIIAANNTDLLFGRDQSNSFTERMRLRNDGKLLINRTGVDGSGMLQVAVSGVGITTATGSQSSTTHLEFRNQSGTVGTIKTDGNNSSFNTSSDYRLKENVAAIADGIERLKQLKPKKFNWISDEKDTLLDGFLAHEVADVIPEAITGEKDAVDTDGKPIWQQIDHSKLVPLLVSAVQELIGKVEILEAA